MSSSDWKRLAIHIPVGMLIVFSIFIHWAVLLVFGTYFIIYEIWQEKIKHDRAYKDIIGALTGQAIAVVYLLLR